jgi:hypothetical protein
MWTLLLLAATIRGSEVEIVCPAEVQVEQKATVVPEGWEPAVVPTRHLLANAEFSDGHPRDRAILRPSKDSRKVARYDFQAASDQGTWLACVYRQTTLKLARKLPANVTTCVVEYTGSDAKPIARIRCTDSSLR